MRRAVGRRTAAAACVVWVALGLVPTGHAEEPATAPGGEARIGWQPVGDGVTVGYEVLIGSAPRAYDRVEDAGSAAGMTVDGLTDCATSFFAVRGYGSDGRPTTAPSEEIAGWPRPRVELALPSGARVGTTADLTFTGANFDAEVTVEVDAVWVRVVSVERRSCRELALRVEVSDAAPLGPVPLYVVNGDRTFGAVEVVVEPADLAPPGAVPTLRRSDVVPEG